MNNNKNNKGLVLVGVLWIVIVLTAIVSVMGRKSRLDSKICLARSEAIRAKWACRAGIERAVAILNEDERETDGHNDIWYSSYEDFNDFAMHRCFYNVKIIDESGKLNINTATWDQLMGLPYMSEDIADAIIDWRDSDNTLSKMGTEDGYYENLPFGYPNQNGPFRTIHDLLLVRDVTEELFYGEDTNLNGKLDYNEMDGDVTLPYDNGDAWLDLGWAAYITCYTSSGTQDTTNQGTQATGQTGQNTEQTDQDTGQSATISSAVNQSQNTWYRPTMISFAVNQNQNTGYPTMLFATAGNQGQTTGQTQDTGQTTEVDGLININTASEVVLAALMGGTDVSYAAAQSIIGYRKNLLYGIEDISELTEQGVISSDMLSMIQEYVTVNSNIFTIRCTATAERAGYAGTTLITEAVIDRSTSPYKVLYWYQGASN